MLENTLFFWQWLNFYKSADQPLPSLQRHQCVLRIRNPVLFLTSGFRISDPGSNPYFCELTSNFSVGEYKILLPMAQIFTYLLISHSPPCNIGDCILTSVLRIRNTMLFFTSGSRIRDKLFPELIPVPNYISEILITIFCVGKYFILLPMAKIFKYMLISPSRPCNTRDCIVTSVLGIRNPVLFFYVWIQDWG